MDILGCFETFGGKSDQEISLDICKSIVFQVGIDVLYQFIYFLEQ